MSCAWTKERWTGKQLAPYVKEIKEQEEYGPQYYSQRGEDCPPRLDKDLCEYLLPDNSEEFAYIFRDDKWVCYDMHSFDNRKLPEVVPIPKGALMDWPTKNEETPHKQHQNGRPNWRNLCSYSSRIQRIRVWTIWWNVPNTVYICWRISVKKITLTHSFTKSHAYLELLRLRQQKRDARCALLYERNCCRGICKVQRITSKLWDLYSKT